VADEPEYNVYRSRKTRFGSLKRDQPGGLADLQRRKREGPRRPRRPFRFGRVIKWLVVAAIAWIALSVVAFFVSAQFAPHTSGNAEAALSPGGNLLAGSTILVLGSDARPSGTKEPGAGGPARSDSMMLMRVGLGSVRKVSILRDSQAEIPGHGVQKINAAYALGGAGLAIQTVEQFMDNGLKINHVLEISFEDFPKLIDALGGINVTLRHCIHSNQFGGRKLLLHRGKNHLNGRQALAFSRVRKNQCRRNEDDRARARRQQEVMQAIRKRVFSPTAFVRMPLVAWAAPRTVRSDMRGPGLMGLALDILTSPSGTTRVLLPTGANGSQLIVSPDARRRAVDYLLGR
jgi:LCP family protein required for cell wall assembly